MAGWVTFSGNFLESVAFQNHLSIWEKFEVIGWVDKAQDFVTGKSLLYQFKPALE